MFRDFARHHVCRTVSSASGEKKKRKAITPEMELQIVAQLQASVSVLTVFQAGCAVL